MKRILIFTFVLILSAATAAQTETLSNAQIIEMTRVGLAPEIILNKVRKSTGNFDLSAAALIELKKAGVDDSVIALITELGESRQSSSDNDSAGESKKFANKIISPKEALTDARTIAFQKSSIQPSRQALEKELLKLADWKKLNLAIERFKDNADLYVEIGYVPMSWITHRYVYRVYDRRSGAVIAAGETTSWGSLAENLARHIVLSLDEIAKS